SVLVFTAAVVGGLGSIVGAGLGAGYLEGADWLLPGTSEVGQTLGTMLDLLPTAVGVLVVLLVLPGGLGGLVQRARDGWLRSVARRNGLIVPGLAAAPPDDTGVLGEALAAERDLERLLVGGTSATPGAAATTPEAGT